MDFTQQPLEAQRRWGFGTLLHEFAILRRGKSDDWIWRPTYLGRHPFGLNMPPVMSGNVALPPRFIKFVGYPGYTDSTRVTAALVADALADEGRKVTYLRVIYAEEMPGKN